MSEGHGVEDPLRPPIHPSIRRCLSSLGTAVAMTLALGACGDAGMLDGLGERGHEYVEGSTTLPAEETAATTEAPMSTSPVEGKRWYNEEIPGETLGDPSFVVSAVWLRSDGITRFIQASPNEISAALPGIEFPSLVPTDTFSITSQLVFDVASGTLDPELLAAFGFWPSTPYAAESASTAILRVAEQSGGALAQGITVVPAENGVNIRWSEGSYSYELFCRTPLTESTCQEMALSTVALEIIAPAITSE